jgi:anti-sigma B factor antagonist
MDLTTRINPPVATLVLSGSFTNTTFAPARLWLDDATAEQPAFVVVDMAAVHFIDSTGLSTLVNAMKRARAVGGDLKLAGLQQPVRMIFEMTRLDRVFDIFNHTDDAVQAFLLSGEPSPSADEGGPG